MKTIAAEIVTEDLLAARIACLESHESFEDMDDGCIALLELEAALDAEERIG